MQLRRDRTWWVAVVLVAGLPAGNLPFGAVQYGGRSSTREEQIRLVVKAAMEQTEYTRYYDPAYVGISYPGGDVPRDRGVCTDVIIRAFRAAQVDLQKEVHVDMAANFSAYPNRWGNRGTDRNIDHRRVPNLMVFFEREQKSLAVTQNASDYRAGDVVVWDLGGGVLHMGLVTDSHSTDTNRLLLVHNLSAGARLEDVLFAWKIVGHYRYF